MILEQFYIIFVNILEQFHLGIKGLLNFLAFTKNFFK